MKDIALLKTIWFKSIPKNYLPESLDLKRNTVRFTDDWDLSRWVELYKAEAIGIINTETQDNFIRKITHKCIYKNLIIISW